MAVEKQNKPAKRAETSLARLSKIPVIEFTVVLTLSAYHKVKSSSDLFTNVLNRAENIATTALDSLRPVVAKFEKQSMWFVKRFRSLSFGWRNRAVMLPFWSHPTNLSFPVA